MNRDSRRILRNLCVMTYAGGFTLWHYNGHSDTCTEIQAPGYFDDAREMIKPCDIVMITCADGALQVYFPKGGAQPFVVMSSTKAS